MVAGEIAAKHCDLQQVSGEHGPLKRGFVRDASIRSSAVISAKGENAVGRGVRLCAR
jgi:hypothetical protein